MVSVQLDDIQEVHGAPNEITSNQQLVIYKSI